MRFIGKVYIMPRKDLLDPQGNAVLTALKHLGFTEVKDVRVGKAIDVFFEADEAEAALGKLKDMCEKLLVNPITEDYDYILMSDEGGKNAEAEESSSDETSQSQHDYPHRQENEQDKELS